MSNPHANHQGEPGDTRLERVRHLKRGTEYEVLGEAEAQVSEGMKLYQSPGAARVICEGERLVVYRCVTTGKLWIRFPDEMHQGRFERIASAPSPEAGAGGDLGELAEAEIRSRAAVMVRESGWKPGDKLHGTAVLELMTKLGVDLTLRPVTDRCAYPECGCDADATCRDALIRSGKLVASTGSGEETKGETLESIAAWCEQTFGPVEPARVAKRAAEEMDELLAEPTKVEEAADVVIVLSRYPGLWEAIERKMAVNRARKWRLMGDGTGYHVKAPAPCDGSAEGGETGTGSTEGNSAVREAEAP